MKLVRARIAAVAVGRITAGWSGKIDVVDRRGVSLEPTRVAQMVVEDPDLVPELRTMLEELGVPLHRRPAGGEEHTGFPLLTFHRTTGPRRLPGTGFPGLEGSS